MSEAGTAALMGIAPTAGAVTTQAPAAAPVAPANNGSGGGQPAPSQGAKPAEAEKGATAGAPATPPDEGKVDAERLRNLVVGNETPEQKVARLERDHSASSREARRLLENWKAANALLEEQGIAVVEQDGKIVGFAPAEGKQSDAKAPKIDFRKLTPEEQALAESDPQKFVDSIASRVASSMVRPKPTLEERPPQQPSPEVIRAAAERLAQSKWDDGSDRYSAVSGSRDMIEQVLASPSTPKDLRDLAARSPDLAVELVHLRLEHARSFLRAASASSAKPAAKEKADNTPPFGPGGPGAATIQSGGEPSSRDIGRAIAGAHY